MAQVKSFSSVDQSNSELITRVRQYLEANVHKTFVDIEDMTTSLMNKYSDYSRRKKIPFRNSVEQAYKLVLRDYGLDSNNGSEGESDLEVMDDMNESSGNQLNNALTNMYMKKPNTVTSSSENAAISIDISSDEEDSAADNSEEVAKTFIPPAPQLSPGLKITTNGTKSSVNENKTESAPRPGPASQKKRKIEISPQNSLNASGETSGKTQPSQYQSSKPKKFKKEVYARSSNVTFADVGGADKILRELCELILHIKHPEMYKHIGLPPPRGILLCGAPGSGKTLLAHAIAGQLGVLLVEVPATELVAGVSGESEERIREIFEQAAVFAPCVLFIDEIDAISSNRQNAQKDMERRIVSQLLTSLDNMSKLKFGDQVLVIGATNRPEVLDPALRRVGRFDHEISLGIPDRNARSQILKIISRNLRIHEDFDYDEIALLTPGYVPADLLALTTRAALTAIKRTIRNHDKTLDSAPITSESVENVETVVENQEKVDENPVEIPKDDNQMEIDTEEKQEESLVDEIKDSTEVPSEQKDEQMISDEAEKKIEEISQPQPVEEMKEDEIESPQEEKVVENTKPKEFQLVDMLKWLETDNQPVSNDELLKLFITRDDFVDALKHIQPSAKREGFVTVPDVTWNDIGSLQNIRNELKLSILAPVKFPEKLEQLGLQSPSGILLCGPPGCGKTLLAKAVANEAGINFISVKGPELLNMYVGESERAVRQCFQRARNSAPCVIFFDEFDSLCPKRSDSGENSSQRVVNQLLTEMDGIEDRKGVFLMAATNRPDIIDPAVLRPGRLDKVLYVGLPELKDRSEILRALTKNGSKPEIAEDVDFDEIASLTGGYTGADLAGMVRQASLQTLKESIEGVECSGNLKVHRNHFIEVIKKIKPSVTAEDIKHYSQLESKYGVQQEN